MIAESSVQSLCTIQKSGKVLLQVTPERVLLIDEEWAGTLGWAGGEVTAQIIDLNGGRRIEE